MDTKEVLRKSWQMVWQYRALWILAMVLALTAANTIYLGPWQETQDQPQNLKVILTDAITIRLPGDGLTIDLTAPAGSRVIFTDGSTWHDFPFLKDPSGQLHLSDIWAIVIEILSLVVLIGLTATLARYVAETAMIRMVSDTEDTGKQLTFRQGVRLGWSARAGRLFLIDLLVGLVMAGFAALAVLLFIGPIILVNPHGLAAILLTAFGAFGLLVLPFTLYIVGSALLSLIMPTVRRACVIDNLGVFASMGTGFGMLKRHLKEVGTTWLIWIAIRILWAPASVLVTLILLPILLTFMLAGFLTSLIPGVLAGGFADLFVNGVTPWIIGIIAGLPIFILVTIIPMLLVGGWVEIYKSSLWTLSYRALRAREHTVQAAQPQKPLVPARGIAD
jgi:hypothetical protein